MTAAKITSIADRRCAKNGHRDMGDGCCNCGMITYPVWPADVPRPDPTAQMIEIPW